MLTTNAVHFTSYIRETMAHLGRCPKYIAATYFVKAAYIHALNDVVLQRI